MSYVENLSFDQLGVMAEEEVATRLRQCRDSLSGNHSPAVRMDWEFEAAKSQRELGMRQDRRKLHTDYLNRIAAEDAAEQSREYTLPEYEGNKIPQFVREMFVELGLTWEKN